MILIAALPLVLGAALVAQSAAMGRAGNPDPVPLRYLPGLFFPWLLYGLLAPAVYLLVERVPLAGPGWTRRVPVHAVAALGFAMIHQALGTTLHLMVYRPPDLSWLSFYRNNLGGYLVSEVVQYVFLAGTCHALLFRADIRDRERARLQLEARLAEARLQALSRQVSPHFLLNALNTVAALARRGDADAVCEVVSDLGDLLRFTLSDAHGPLVPVWREIEGLERYVAIQRARFGERLTVHIAVAADVRDAAVPTMVLQPLVENAVKHGLARHRDALTVSVRLRTADSTVELTVVDDGPGFPTPPDGLELGVGLENLQGRLQALFGAESTLDLGRSEAGGARVCVRFPFAAAVA